MKERGLEAIHIHQLRWAIWFSDPSEDLDKVAAGMKTAYGGMEELKHRLYEFVRDAGLQGNDFVHQVQTRLVSPKEYLDLSIDEMKRAQREVRNALLAFADTKVYALRLGDARPEQRVVLKNPLIQWVSFLHTNPFSQSVTVEGDPVSLSVLAVGLHVAFSGLSGEKIRICARSECGMIFIRERKPQKTKRVENQYCSLACTRAAATKRYRLKQKGEAGQAAISPQKAETKERRKTPPRKMKRK